MQRELNEAWITRIDDLSETRRSNIDQIGGVAGVEELSVIEEVERLTAENESLVLGDAHSLGDRQIGVEDSGPMEHIAAKITVTARALRGRATGADTLEVGIPSTSGRSAAGAIEIRIG